MNLFLDLNKSFFGFFVQDIWKIRVQLAKSVTSPPLIWGVVCGAVASGTFA
ncbi:putative chlorophyll synthase [Helianthus annuus]|nr:putative chlorophyll synthase [Helianthus annuus]